MGETVARGAGMSDRFAEVEAERTALREQVRQLTKERDDWIERTREQSRRETAARMEVERLQVIFAWYAGIDSDDAAWEGLDKFWQEQGITVATWRQAIDEVAEQGRGLLREKGRG